jgi:polyketide cyclase/dehydrase/lipid transport protein
VLIESDAVIPAPPADVYAAVADLAGRPTWLTEMSDVDAPPGPATPGTRFTASSALLMHRFHGVSEICDADGVSMLSEDVHLGARFHSTWWVESTDTGAVLRHRIDLDLPRGPLRVVIGPLLAWRLRRMSRRSLRILAARLSQAS